MAAIIAGGALLGNYLNNKFESAQPWPLVVCTLFGVFAAMYFVIKDVLKQNESE